MAACTIDWTVGQVFRRTSITSAWVLDGVVDAAGTVSPAAGAMLVNQTGVQSDGVRLSIPWAALEIWAAMTDVGESVFAAAYNADGKLVGGTVFALPRVSANSVESLIARDQRYLDALIVARAECDRNARSARNRFAGW